MTILNFKEIPDLSFYVYMRDKPNRIETIKNKSLWFSCCDEFNDPYDSQLDLHNDINDQKDFQMAIHTLLVNGMKKSQQDAAKEMLKIGSKKTEKEKFLYEICDDLLKNVAKNHGIACFSSNGLSHQMWGYYADKHQGLCVEYEKPSQECLTSLNGTFGYVSYGNPARITFSSFVNYFRFVKTIEEKAAYFQVLVDQHFYQKESNWRHESEYRIVSPKYKNASAPFDCKIKSITFGMKMSPERKIEIYNLLKDSLDETIFRNITRKNCSWDMEPKIFDPKKPE